MKKIFAGFALVGLLASPALAAKYDLEIPSGLLNDTFKDVVSEAGALVAYRGVAPAEPQGLTGFDIGVEVSAIKLDSDVWDQVLNGDTPSYVGVPKVHVRKGLPFGIDLGASYAEIPSSNIKIIGGELQYAILDGSAATPALALRGHYSKLNGVDDLDVKAYGADAVISKGILMFTPYAGAGALKIKGEYTGIDPTLQTQLQDQDETQYRVFGGVQVAIALFRLTLDAEFSEVPVYTAKVSLGW